MKQIKLAMSALVLAMGVGGGAANAATNTAPTLSPADFEKAKTM